MRVIIEIVKVPVFGVTPAFRGRVFFDIRGEDRYRWLSDTGGGYTRIGSRGFGTWEQRLLASQPVGRDWNVRCREQIRDGHQLAMILRGSPMDLLAPVSQLQGEGEVMYSANPAFRGAITWHATRISV